MVFITGGNHLLLTNTIKAIEMRIKELEEMAMLDNLTRIPNRNYIEKELMANFDEQKRFGVTFGILFMDIDHFKRFNDTYGHDVGDRTLKFVADTLLYESKRAGTNCLTIG